METTFSFCFTDSLKCHGTVVNNCMGYFHAWKKFLGIPWLQGFHDGGSSMIKFHGIPHNHDDVIKWKHFPRYCSFVTGEFPSQRPVTQSLDIFFDLRLNKQLSKQSMHRWFETSSKSLWRHCNVFHWVWGIPRNPAVIPLDLQFHGIPWYFPSYIERAEFEFP